LSTTNKITFTIGNLDSYFVENTLPPIEAYKKIPDWYKDLASYRSGSSNNIKYLCPVNDRGQDGSDVSTKLCTPFIDAMVSGYIQPLSEDVNVSVDENEKPSLEWSSTLQIIDVRPSVDLAIPQDCYPIHFGWKMAWHYETPPGYSVLITHPFNRFDLPFYVPSGIVDSDIWGLPVFLPFFLKRGFEGIIEKGTPQFQMIPIKRDKWELEIDNSKETFLKHKILEETRRASMTGHYKKTAWQKKNY
jgi:hypothetical protein